MIRDKSAGEMRIETNESMVLEMGIKEKGKFLLKSCSSWLRKTLISKNCWRWNKFRVSQVSAILKEKRHQSLKMDLRMKIERISKMNKRKSFDPQYNTMINFNRISNSKLFIMLLGCLKSLQSAFLASKQSFL